MPRIAICGTDSAYRRHLRLGETPCAPCRAAHVDASVAQAKRKRLERLRSEPCGTPGGFRRHRAGGEQPCGMCAAANKQAYADRFEAKEKEKESQRSETPFFKVAGATTSFADRVFSYVDVGHPAGCWWWTGATDEHGYGYIGRGRRGSGNIAAYRAVWELLVGPIPGGMSFDHRCLNHSCVNPDHGEIVPGRVNTSRGWLASSHRRRTTCHYGHPLDGRHSTRGWRYCKTCTRLAKVAARRRRSSDTSDLGVAS